MCILKCILNVCGLNVSNENHLYKRYFIFDHNDVSIHGCFCLYHLKEPPMLHKLPYQPLLIYFLRVYIVLLLVYYLRKVWSNYLKFHNITPNNIILTLERLPLRIVCCPITKVLLFDTARQMKMIFVTIENKRISRNIFQNCLLRCLADNP